MNMSSRTARYDFARPIGISIGTVSRAINRTKGVRPQNECAGYRVIVIAPGQSLTAIARGCYNSCNKVLEETMSGFDADYTDHEYNAVPVCPALASTLSSAIIIITTIPGPGLVGGEATV